MSMGIGNDDPNDQNPQDPAAQAVDDSKTMNQETDPGLANLDRVGGILRHRQETQRPTTPLEARKADNKGLGNWDYGNNPGESTEGTMSYTGHGTGHGVNAETPKKN